MRNFISPPKDWDFQVKNVPQTSKRHRDKWISFKSIKSPYILIKVGMTTQLPNVRIKQWELKCKHELVNMGPANSHLAKPHLSWWQRMANLSLEDGQRVDATYRNLQNEGFYCNGNLKNVEMAIHSKLRANYGKGDVFCSGCVSDDDLTVNKSTKAVPLRHNFKVHVEWFLVPKTDLTSVYKLIDETCNAHARAN
ncbi:uncharacterized protein LODBEIA_P49600 [Lodderomyces beijingensis]|uniref:Bacteriophage T5 Orf172 DNA-binding domain-containing protein n=1 Tax=Lodderomyces beijingensis TaxID=1775926 RepID=A0ABP0ZRE2_9ASCO